MLTSLCFFQSLGKAVGEHLKKAREIVNEVAEDGHYSKKPSFCFTFVNEILKSTLSGPALEELNSLNEKIQSQLPPAHQYHEMIPYHYSLIASELQYEDQAVFWKVRSIYDVMPGDILTYIDPKYDPDPNHQEPNRQSITHIVLVDEILERNSSNLIKMRVIDASSRTRGRGFTPNYYTQEDKRLEKKGCIAYSILSLNLLTNQDNQDESMCECEFFGHQKRRKLVSLLYLTDDAF